MGNCCSVPIPSLSAPVIKKIANLGIYSTCVMTVVSVVLTSSSTAEMKTTGLYCIIIFASLATCLTLFTYPPTCLRSRAAFRSWWFEFHISREGSPFAIHPQEVTVVACSTHCIDDRVSQMVSFTYHTPEECLALCAGITAASHSRAAVRPKGLEVPDPLEKDGGQAKADETRPATGSQLSSRGRDRVVLVRPASWRKLESCLAPDCCSRCCGMARVGDGCTICLSEYENGDRVSRLPCVHFFHKECIEGWVEQHNRCPMCKGLLSPVISHQCLQRSSQVNALQEEEEDEGLVMEDYIV